MKYIFFIIAGLIILSFLQKWKQAKQAKRRGEKDWTSWLRQYEKEQKTLDKQVERNLRGIALEKKGRIDEAIELYEKNISENFIGTHPYNRLAIIYRKRNQIDDEIRVLEKAIRVFEGDEFKKRVQKARKLKCGS
jgi:tetratricopeptide (TPR) repeat protein